MISCTVQACHTNRWFAPREQRLKLCIQHDSGSGSSQNDDLSRVQRIALAEILHRGLYLHKFVMKHGYIMNPAAKTTPKELVKQAQELLTPLECSEELLGSIGLTGERLILDGRFEWPFTKVIAVHLGAEASEVALGEFHLKVSTLMSTHLVLTVENFDTAEWRVAGLLSTQPSVAQQGAAELHEHLKRKAIADLSAFERCLRLDDAMWVQLGEVVDCAPPTLLWKNGTFKNLFFFLGALFWATKTASLAQMAFILVGRP